MAFCTTTEQVEILKSCKEVLLALGWAGYANDIQNTIDGSRFAETPRRMAKLTYNICKRENTEKSLAFAKRLNHLMMYGGI